MCKPGKAALGKLLFHLKAMITQVQSLMKLTAGLGAKRLRMRKSGKAAASSKLFLHSTSFQFLGTRICVACGWLNHQAHCSLRAETWQGRTIIKPFLHVLPLEDVT